MVDYLIIKAFYLLSISILFTFYLSIFYDSLFTFLLSSGKFVEGSVNLA